MTKYVRQPNGLFAGYDVTADKFVQYNLSADAAKDLYLRPILLEADIRFGSDSPDEPNMSAYPWSWELCLRRLPAKEREAAEYRNAHPPIRDKSMV